MAEVKLSAPAIHCEGCASSIKRALGRVAGVSQVAVDVATRTVTVGYDDAALTLEAIAARMDAIGFPVDAG